MIIETFPVRTLCSSPAEWWCIKRDADGAFTAEQYIDLTFLTPGERKQRAEDDAGFGPPLYELEPEPRWPTIELAREWAALQDAFVSIGDDLSAFNAPEGCAPAAYGPLEMKEQALLTQQFKKPNPGPLWPFPEESEN